MATLGVTQAAQADPAACDNYKITIYQDSLWLTYTIPAKFPTPAQSKSNVLEDWALSCPTVVAGWQENVGNGFIQYKDGLVKHLGNDIRNPYIFYTSGYKYPSIKEGFFYAGLALTMSDGRIGIKNTDWYGSDAVIAVKINNGSLQPLYFDGKPTDISFTKGDVIDVFAQGSSVQWRQITIETATDTIRFMRKASFPSN